MSRRFPIVGMQFRPPAQEIINSLSTGTLLILRPEPQNPADSNARAVLIKTANLSDASIAALDDGRLKPHNLKIKDILDRDEWHLGYIPAVMASHPTIVAIKRDLEGRFSLSADGKPRITTEEP